MGGGAWCRRWGEHPVKSGGSGLYSARAHMGTSNFCTVTGRFFERCPQKEVLIRSINAAGFWLFFFTEEGGKHPPRGRKMTLHTWSPPPPPPYITEQRGDPSPPPPPPPLLNPETNIYCGVIRINTSFGLFNTELKRHLIGNYKWFMCVVCVCASVCPEFFEVG